MDFFNTEENASFSAALVLVKLPPPQGKQEAGIVFKFRCAAFKEPNICSSVSCVVQTHLTAAGHFILRLSATAGTTHFNILAPNLWALNTKLQLDEKGYGNKKTPAKKSLHMGMLSQLWSSGRNCSISLAIEALSCYLNILTCHQRKGKEWLHFEFQASSCALLHLHRKMPLLSPSRWATPVCCVPPTFSGELKRTTGRAICS